MITSQTSIHSLRQRLTVVTACAALLLSSGATFGRETDQYYLENNSHCANVNIGLKNKLGMKVLAGTTVQKRLQEYENLRRRILTGGSISGYSFEQYRPPVDEYEDLKRRIEQEEEGGLQHYTDDKVTLQMVTLKTREYEDSLQRYQSYLQGVSMQRQGILDLRRDVVDARNCYDQKWREVIAQFDSGTIGKDEMEKRLKEIRAGLEQVKQIIAEARASLGTQRMETRQVMEVEQRLLKVISEDVAQPKIYLDANQPQGAKIFARILAYGRASRKTDVQLAQQLAILDAQLAKFNKTGEWQKLGVQAGVEMSKAAFRAFQALNAQQRAEIEADIQALQEMDVQQRQQRISEIEKQLDSNFTEHDQALSDLLKTDKDRKIKVVERAKRELPQSAQSQPNAGRNQRQDSGKGELQPVNNKQMNAQQSRLVSKIEKRLDNHFDQADQDLKNLYDADAERAIQRKQEASARGLEL